VSEVTQHVNAGLSNSEDFISSGINKNWKHRLQQYLFREKKKIILSYFRLEIGRDFTNVSYTVVPKLLQ